MTRPNRGLRAARAEQTAKRDEEIKRLFAQENPRLSDRQIGEVVGMATGSVRNRRVVLELKRDTNAGGMGGTKPISRERIATEFKAGGVDAIPEIARRLGCSRDHIRRVLRAELKLLPPARREVPIEVWRKADEMLDGTIPFREVAETLGVSHAWVSTNFTGRGLARENVGAYNAARRMEARLGL